MDDFVLKTFDNTFPQEFVDIFLQYNSAPMWEMKTDHFYNDLDDFVFFTETCLDHINNLTKCNHKVIRCYRHALNSGKICSPHYDTHNPTNRTFLVWMHPFWDKLWGGQIRVGENLETQIDCLPNSSVYFSAKHNQHYISPFKTENFRITTHLQIFWERGCPPRPSRIREDNA